MQKSDSQKLWEAIESVHSVNPPTAIPNANDPESPKSKLSDAIKSNPTATCTIDKWKGSRDWAVWLNVPNSEPELVCVTVYKRGADTVKALVEYVIKKH